MADQPSSDKLAQAANQARNNAVSRMPAGTYPISRAKRLNQESTLEEIETFLRGLQSSFLAGGQFAGDQDVYVRLEQESQPKRLKTHNRRRTGDDAFPLTQTKNDEHLHLLDAASLLGDTYAWLKNREGSNATVRSLLEQPQADDNPLDNWGRSGGVLDTDIPAGLASEALLDNHSTNMREMCQILLQALEALKKAEKGEKTTAVTTNLKPLVEAVENDPVAAWGDGSDNKVLFVAKAFEQTQIGETEVTFSSTNHDPVAIMEARSTFDLYIEHIRDIIKGDKEHKSRDQILGYLDHSEEGKKLEWRKRILSDELSFKTQGIDTALVTELEQLKKTQHDQQVIREFIAVFGSLFKALLKEKIVIPDVAADGSEAEGGSEESQDLDEKPTLELSYLDFAVLVAQEFSNDVIGHLPQLTQAQTVLNQLQATQPDHALVDRLAEQLSTITAELRTTAIDFISEHEYTSETFIRETADLDEETNLLIFNDTWYQQHIAPLLRTFTADFASRNNVVELEQTIEQCLAILATTSQQQDQESKQQLAPETPPITAGLPSNLDELLEVLAQAEREGVDSLDQDERRFLDIWLGMSIQERAAFLRRVGALRRLGSDGTRLFDLPKNVRDEIESLLYQDVANSLNASSDIISDVLKLDGARRRNLFFSLETLVLLSRNPDQLINNLTEADLTKYFDIQLSGTPQERAQLLALLKAEFLRYIQLRRYQEHWAGLEDDAQAVDTNFNPTRRIVSRVGTNTAINLVATPYGTEDAPGLSEQDVDQQKQQRQQFQAQLWNELATWERRALIAQLGTQVVETTNLEIPPQNFVPYQAAEYLQQNSAQVTSYMTSGERRRQRARGLLGRRQAATGDKLLNTAANVTEKGLVTGASLAANAVAPVVGGAFVQATNRARKFLGEALGLSEQQQNQVILGGLAAAGLFAANTIRLFLSSWGGFIGGLFGGGVGGGLGFLLSGGNPFAAGIGGASGFTSGVYAGNEFIGGGGGPLRLIGVDGSLSGIADYFGVSQGTASVSSTLSGPLGINGIGGLAAAGSVGVLAVGSMVTTTTIQTAFLLPTVGVDGDISKYVEIEKVAQEGHSFENNEDFPGTITYSITITPKDSYELTVTDFSDTITLTFAEEASQSQNGELVTRTIDDIAELSAGQVITADTPVSLSYTQEFGSVTDANITNQVVLSFDVIDEDGQSVSTTASTSEVICVGECPQSQGEGCWPTSGIITQRPFEPELLPDETGRLVPGTHNKASGVEPNGADAFDIATVVGTPVYAPFAGDLCAHPFMAGGYGKYLTIENISGVPGIGPNDRLLFGHLSSTIVSSGCTPISVGEPIGAVGNTGNSTGSHLHYALAPAREPSRLSLLVPDPFPALKTGVRSCHEAAN